MPPSEGAAPPRFDAVVVGAGVIGLALARELAGAGLRVALYERSEPGREASWAAAGMLVPGCEFDTRSPLGTLGARSLELYPEFIATLEAETDRDCDLRLLGALQPELGSEVPRSWSRPGVGQRVEGAALRELEPALAPEIHAAVLHPGHGSVDNRALVAALERSCELRGVTIRRGSRVLRVLCDDGRVRGVATEDGQEPAALVVNAAGAWASEIDVAGAAVEVRPVKGQMLSLDQSRLRASERVERVIFSERAYVVPRSDGRVVIGATVEERGFDKSVDATSIERLRHGAISVAPALTRAAVLETWAGLRPRGPAEPPTLGPAGPDGYWLAVGHYRNGILLTPVTVEILARAILSRAA